MKKILFIAPRLPYPPISGYNLKNYWLLQILSKHYIVHLVCITDEHVPSDFHSWAEKIGITYKLFPKKRIDFYLKSAKSIFNKLPIQVNYYSFQDVKEYVDSVYEAYDLIYVISARAAQYALGKSKPKIADMGDLHSVIYSNAKEKTKSKFWKIVYLMEANPMSHYESLCVSNFDKALFFNMEERNFFNEPTKTEWIPHGVNESLFTYEKQNEKYRNWVTFLGKMDYQPNIDVVLWFVANVLPRLDQNLTFGIVGAYPTKKVKSLERKYKNVVVTGFVEDPYEIVKSSLCVVAPMQTGGGIQNKVLESMALGTVSIVSSLAAKPIGARNMEEFLVIDDPVDIALTINDIYKNPDKYVHIKEKSREYIKANFTWSIYERKIIDVIKSVLGD